MNDDAFKPVSDIKAMMDGFPALWFVAGGWAVDLFLGYQSRPHSDIEIGMFRRDQQVLRAFLSRWQCEKVENGISTPWMEEEWLELPIHEIHARSQSEQPFDLEILLQEEVEGQWAYRRLTSIRSETQQMILHSPDGVPYLAPEIVLLFKAKQKREKDDRDFAAVHDKLSAKARQWLHNAIEQCDSQHKWLASLTM